MAAQPRRVGRPRKHTLRLELRLNADDPMVTSLVSEAETRHVMLQQHITDVLTARYLYMPQPTAPESPDALVSTAGALADEWM